MSDLSPAARLLFRPSARLRANRETRGLGQGAWMVCWSAGTGDRDEIWALRGDCGLGLWRAAQGMRSEVVGVLGSGFVGAKEGRGVEMEVRRLRQVELGGRVGCARRLWEVVHLIY